MLSGEGNDGPPALGQSEIKNQKSKIKNCSDFDLDRILRDTFVRQVDFQPSAESTNDRGLELAKVAGTRCPLLTIAEQQTAGRGRGGNQWWSAAGALTFSLVVDAERFRLTPHNRPQVSLTAGLAVCESLEELLPAAHVGLKWPNDVLLDGRKVCGSLIEAPASEPDRLVIGIGINVNNSLASAPVPLRHMATSLVDAANRPFDRTDVLVAILLQLEQGLERLHRRPDDLVTRWRQYCVLRGRTVSLAVNERQVVGNCEGIDGDGALVLKTGNGSKRYFSGVVTGIG